MTQAASISFTYPLLPPKEFDRNGSATHWSKLSRIQDQVAHDIHGLLLEAGYDGTMWGKAEVTFTFVLPDHRVRDGDNLVAASKPLLDSLKGVVFKDDDLKCIGMVIYKYRYEKGVSATEITVTERKE